MPRRRIIGAAAALVLAVIAVVVIALVDSGRPGSRAGAAASASETIPSPAGSSPARTPSARSTATKTPEASAPGSTGATATHVNVDQLPPTLAPVSLDRTVVNHGVTASLTRLEAIVGQASGIGQVDGPALRITVRLRNGSASRLSLEQASVNVSYGADQTPAPPLADSSSAPFAGSLAPGDTAQGVYVFRVPKSARNSVRVEVAYRAGAPIMVFTGAAP
jgi:hypothetical protein